MVKIKQKLEAPKQASSYVLEMPQPPARNAEEYLKAYVGYIYTAVGAIAQEVASIDLHLYEIKYTKGKPKITEVYEHEVLSVLHYVNQLATLYDVIEATQIYLELTGEAFWVVLKDTSGRPVEFWLLRPDWVKVIPSATDVIDHYAYFAGGIQTERVDIPKGNIIPFKYFHPLNPYRGKGTVQAAALPFDILNFAQEYNRNFFFNSAIPSMVFSTDQTISETTIKRFLAQWQSSFGGRSKSNKVAFLGKGLKLDKVQQGANELDFANQMKMMRDDVLAVFKVPKTVLGLTEDVNRANADATTRAFMERVVTPRMRKFVDSLNEFFLPMFIGNENNLFIDFTDPSPEDVELKLKRYENGRKNGWLTPNEIRAEENLEPVEGGDDLSPVASNAPGQLPQDPNAEPTPEGDTSTQDPQEDDSTKPTSEDAPKGMRGLITRMFGTTKTKKKYVPIIRQKEVKHMVRIPVKRPDKLRREQLAESFVAPLEKFIKELVATDEYSPLLKSKPKGKKIEDKALEAIKKFEKKEVNQKEIEWSEEQKGAFWRMFIKKVDEREVTIKERCKAIFSEQEKMVLVRIDENVKAWKTYIGLKAVVADVVPSLEELSRMWVILQQLLQEIYIEQGNDTMAFLGVGGQINITTEFASQYLLEYGGTMISGINDTTRTQLMQSLSEGFDAGEGADKLKKRVNEIFAEAGKVRAEMIARTEALRASNSATVEAYRQSGVVTGKEWLAQRDGNTCPFCEELDGKIVALDDNYLKKGDVLESGGQKLKIDYADVGEPPAHVSCRCTTIPVVVDASGINASAQDLYTKGYEQNDDFQDSVQGVADDLGANVKKGPVKTVDRIIEKATNEYSGTSDPFANIRDVNRATILINDPKDFPKVLDAVTAKFGSVERVKDKFELEGYRSAIINVKGSNGVVSEIQVTTQEMWDARKIGGGDKLYNLVRTGQDETGEFKQKMNELYAEAQRVIDARLGR